GGSRPGTPRRLPMIYSECANGWLESARLTQQHEGEEKMRPYRKFRLIVRCAAAPLVVCALLLLAEPGLAQDPEPNDDLATAVPIRLPAFLDGCIDPATDFDFYVFSVPDGASLSVVSRELFQLDLFDGRQRLVASGTDFLE